MKAKKIKSTEIQALEFIKQLQLTIDNCMNYRWFNNTEFEKVKEYMKINNPELFIGEESDYYIVYDFSAQKAKDRFLAQTLMDSIIKTMEAQPK
jgi:hypothetical protein